MVRLFNDPALTTIVTSALKQNFDVRIAAERVLQARAVYRITRSDQFPSLDASADVVTTGQSREGATAIPEGADRDVTYMQAGFRLSWELDVWGRLRRLTESSRARYVATEEARRAVVTTLIADVMETYLSVRALDLELEIARRTADVAMQGLRLTRTRQDRGVATALDVRQAEQLLYIARGRIASVERAIAQTENALSLLLGQHPGDISRGRAIEALARASRRSRGAAFDAARTPPRYPPGGAGADCSQCTYRGGQGRVLPAHQPDGVARRAEPVVVRPGDRRRRPVGGRARRNRAALQCRPDRRQRSLRRGRAARAGRELPARIYAALREVADALAGYRKTADARAEQERLVEALDASVRLSTQRYEGGIDNYLQVLDAQRSLFQGELELARLRQQELGSIVQLYRALGGGWNPGTAAVVDAGRTS